jgi:RHS repeat-associated protein
LPAFPGTWWNQSRWGTGWHLAFGDDRKLRLFWFTFDSSGQPVWLSTDSAAIVVDSLSSEDTWSARLKQHRWLGTGSDAGVEVGSVALRFDSSDPTKAAIAWQWSEVGPEPASPECIRDYVRESPSPMGLNSAFSGDWQEPGALGYHALVGIIPVAGGYVESTTLAVFGTEGEARWLFGEPVVHDGAPSLGTDPAMDLVTVPLSVITPVGYPDGVPTSDCSSEACISLRDAGTYARMFESVDTMFAQIRAQTNDISFTRPASTGFARLVKQSAKNLVLVDRLQCEVEAPGGTCDIRVDWSSTSPTSTVIRRRMDAPGEEEVGAGSHGEATDALSAGMVVRYELHATANTSAAPLFVSARVSAYGEPVVPNQPPEVVLQSPIAGQQFTEGDTITFTISASDSDGQITNVAAFANEAKLGDAVPQAGVYRYSWPNVPRGVHVLHAEAIDDGGAVGVSAPISVTVVAPPPVVIELPAADPISDRVGATAAEFRVDESGAATYTIPLFAAPGTAGVVPQMALSYSSQGGVGPAGEGWSISGNSAITRCRKSREAGDYIIDGVPHDGDAGPVMFTDEDAFCLDGQRLLALAGGGACPSRAGHTGSEHRTEIESFQRVCAYPATAEKGPRFFTVQRKDGSTSWYGERRCAEASGCMSQDGLLEANGEGQAGAAFLWAQSRFLDSTGNYIDFAYLKDPGGASHSGEHLLAKVSFTGKITLPGQAGVPSLPYASIDFEYETTAASMGYFSGSTSWRTRRLKAVHSVSGGVPLRYYELSYEPRENGSGSRIDRLASVVECRDSSKLVCLAPTTFRWSQAVHELQPPIIASERFQTGSRAKFEGFKIGDIDGDGRPDIVWVKDAVNSDTDCRDEADHRNRTDQIHVAFSRIDDAGVPYIGALGRYTCAPTELQGERDKNPDSAWFLFDYDGDGRDDLFMRGANRWVGYRSRGTPNGNQRVFDTTKDLLADVHIPAGSKPDQHPQLADLNGNGLTDLVYYRESGLVARLMERQVRTQGNQTSFEYRWGEERAIRLPERSEFDPCADFDVACSFEVAGLYRKNNYQQLNDFNGDARSDLLVIIDVTLQRGCSAGGGGDHDWLPPMRPHGHDDPSPAQNTCTIPWVIAMVVGGVAADGSIPIARYGNGRWYNTYYDTVSFADVNGDGLTDIVHHNETFGIPVYQLNTGTGFGPVSPITEYAAGRPVSLANVKQLQVVDINGDGRADIVYPRQENDRFVVRYALPSGGFGPESTIPGGGVLTGCTSRSCLQERRTFMFPDIDGDGGLDHVQLRWGSSSNADVFIGRAGIQSRGQPRDMLTKITNGLDAVTEIEYKPLTNKDVYRRSLSSRNSEHYGRGAPISDFLAPMYVVSKASSSAPTIDSPLSMAHVHYRYSGARMQAGGRGLLGFREIHSIDTNYPVRRKGNKDLHTAVLTITRYHQDFPFIGRPEETEKWVIEDDQPTPFLTEGCARTGKEDCFTYGGDFEWPRASGGGATRRLISASNNDWESPNYAAGEQSPVSVRLRSSIDVSYDRETGEQLARVHSAFTYDDWENVLTSRVTTSSDLYTMVSQVLTDNSYRNDAATWLLGRLESTEVTHRRPGEVDLVRSSEFAYAMSAPATGLLTMEHIEPEGGEDASLRTFHVLDEFGNRIRSHTCSATLSEAECKSTAVQFQSTDVRRIQRYSRTEYDAAGRFPVASYAPFWNGAGATEFRTSLVSERNAFGDVTRATDMNGVQTLAVFGTLGRAYYGWSQTEPGAIAGDPNAGVATRVTYRRCSGADAVSCPTGAKYRQRSETTGQATSWSYHDALGRPILAVGQSFNAGQIGRDFSAVCSYSDARGREHLRSEPFFLPRAAVNDEPSFGGGNPCASTSLPWTLTDYDVLDRPTLVTRPDNSTLGFEYIGLETIYTDANAHTRKETTNALGELETSTDAGGLTVTYRYNAMGKLRRTERDAGAGLLVNTIEYDNLGRRVASNDPDAGRWTYAYNALGELVTQSGADGRRTEQRYDARGRVFEKRVFAPGGVVETTHRFTFDTAGNGRGQVASEVVEGTYAAWQGDSSLAHRYRRSYEYDALGRASGSTTTIDGVPYTTAVAYDALGRPWKVQDASGRWLKTHFSGRGYPQALCESSFFDTAPGCTEGAPDTYLWTLQTDARGNVVHERRGGTDALDLRRTFDQLTGRLESLRAGRNGVIQHETYGWDDAGNLDFRDKAGQYREVFTYDPLNRLETASYTRVLDLAMDVTSLELTYDALGNICSKTIAGTVQPYTYAGAAGCGLDGLPGSGSSNTAVSPHAVQSVAGTAYAYDIHGNQISADGPGNANDRFVRYDGEQQAYEIALASLANPTKRSRFWYGSDGSRYKREDFTVGADLRRTLYLGTVEIVQQAGQTLVKRQVGGMLLQEIRGDARTDKYLFHDHLGSVVGVVGSDGSVLEGMDYGPFGERRGYADPRSLPIVPQSTERGFTGHEMLDGLDVIHMNGRLYDSRIARFMQADPFVQEANNPQNFNRYTYVWNNPLNASDPSGYLGIKERQWLGAIIMIVAVATQQYWAIEAGSASFFAYYAAAGAISGGVSTQSTSGALWGAFSSMVTAGMGNAYGGAGALTRTAAMGMTGGVLSVMQGGKFGHAFASAGLSALAGPSVRGLDRAGQRAVVGAIVGGTISAATGGKFANGAITGAMSYAFASSANAADGEGGEPTIEQVSGMSTAELRAEIVGNPDTWLAYDDATPEMHARAWEQMTPENRALYVEYTRRGWGINRDIGLTLLGGGVASGGARLLFATNGGRHIFFTGGESALMGALGAERLGQGGTIFSTVVGSRLAPGSIWWKPTSAMFALTSRSALLVVSPPVHAASVWVRWEAPMLRLIGVRPVQRLAPLP